MLCELKDICLLYPINLPLQIKVMVLEFSNHLKYGTRSVRWVLFQ